MRLFQRLTQVRPGLDTLVATSLVEQTERRQPDRQVVLADGLRNGVHEFQDEPASLLRCTAIVICALVDVGHQELLGQISIAAVNLDTVESNVHSRARRATVVLDCALDVLDGQLDGRVVDVQRGLGRSNRRMRVGFGGGVPGCGGGRNRGSTGHLGNGDTASVPELAIDIAAFLMDSVDDTLPASGLLVGE